MTCERVKIGDAVAIICSSGRRMAEKKSQTSATVAWPTNWQALGLAGYRFQYSRKCRLCDATIEFWKTPYVRGKEAKLMPLDRRPDDTFIPHWATCPKADEFRKKKKEQQGDLFG